MTDDRQNVTPDDPSLDKTAIEDTVPTWLRMTVIVLGVAIIIVLGIIVGTLVKRAMNGEGDENVPQVVGQASFPASIAREKWPDKVAFLLLEDEKIKEHFIQGQFLLLTLNNGEASNSDKSFAVIDRATGKSVRLIIAEATELTDDPAEEGALDQKMVRLIVHEGQYAEVEAAQGEYLVRFFDVGTNKLQQLTAIGFENGQINTVMFE